MPKNKILIYLLSTTLVLPTLVSPTAYADTPQKILQLRQHLMIPKNLLMMKLLRILQVKILIKQTTIILVTKTIKTKKLKL